MCTSETPEALLATNRLSLLSSPTQEPWSNSRLQLRTYTASCKPLQLAQRRPAMDQKEAPIAAGGGIQAFDRRKLKNFRVNFGRG